MRDEQQEQSDNELQLQLIRDGENKYQLIPFQASVFTLSIQGIEYRRVAVKLGSTFKANHKRQPTPPVDEDVTLPTSPQADNSPPPEVKLLEELESIDIFGRVLADYLRTRRTPQVIEAVQFLYLEGHAHVTEARLLANELMQGEILPCRELPAEEQVYSLSRVLYLSTVEQESLVEALRITRESRKVAELIRAERKSTRDQEVMAQIVMNQVKQFAQQRQLQNQQNQRLATEVRWLVLALVVTTILGILGALSNFIFN